MAAQNAEEKCMPTATKRASNIATALLVSIIVVWIVTFAAVGLGSDGVTGLCLEEGRPEAVSGYTWAKDHANNCSWTLYSGTFPIRNQAADSVYYSHGITPPEKTPMLYDWQIVMILGAAGLTATLGLWRERLRAPSEDGIVMVPVPVDAG